MIIPVRCFTCGKLVGDKWEEFARRIKTGENDNRGITNDIGECLTEWIKNNPAIISIGTEIKYILNIDGSNSGTPLINTKIHKNGTV